MNSNECTIQVNCKFQTRHAETETGNASVLWMRKGMGKQRLEMKRLRVTSLHPDLANKKMTKKVQILESEPKS